MTILRERGVFQTIPQPSGIIDPPQTCERLVLIGFTDGVPPGTYRMQVVVEFDVNPLRTITVTLQSEPFDIIIGE